jgi:predicted transcriptional regulator
MSIEGLKTLFALLELQPGDVVKCIMALESSELEAYYILLRDGPATVKTMTQKLNKSRPATQKILHNLVMKGLAVRTEVFIGKGGYMYEYKAVPPDVLRNILKRKLAQWYEAVQKLLDNIPDDIIKEIAKKNN